LQEFIADVQFLTNDEVQFQIINSGEPKNSLNNVKSVSEGKIEAAFGYTHNLTEWAPAALLFGSPIAGAGVGIDSSTFLSWFYNAGGSKLYDELWAQMNLNIKGFILQSAVPHSLGWFKEPINSLEDLRRNRFRYQSNISSEILRQIGISIFPMKAADIIPELEKSNLDGVSWCCPKADQELGLHEVMKNYYLQGISKTVLNTDLYINKDIYDKLTRQQKKAIEISARASLNKYRSRMIYKNGKAVRNLIESHNVVIHDTPQEFFERYIEIAHQILEKKARDDSFFAKVWQSQKDFASVAVPYWDNTQTADEILRKAYIKENTQSLD
tara:strand:+ start:355 stop:1335 length:981 start_codon:yes stop_codon:yes gene_type:complete